MIPEKFLTPYDSTQTEKNTYKRWEESGFFNPDNLPGDRHEMFSLVLPPVNVTGVLHVGHAYEDSLQDAVIRFQRMRGKRTLFVPGTDSAAIATQARVEKNIYKEEGKSRHDLGRNELVRRVTEYAKASESTILNQVRRMGASLDWSRYAYTLDEKRNKSVLTAFVRMFEAGLIYRGNRIVNWDPKGQTTISDDEITYEARIAPMYTFRYSKDFPIAISTTRPETKVGDVAVAVHPDDPRYQTYVGKEYDAIFCDVPIHIKIIADKSVDKEFGTGALGVTPAHSQIDWEIADRHSLPRPQVINEYAKMTAPGRLNGTKVTDARGTVVEWLKSEGLLEKEEDIEQNVSTSERTGAIIEPLPKLQWWIDVSKEVRFPTGETLSLKDWMRRAVQSGDVQMPQENFRKTYFHWIDNLRDWCISRQIWFGHRIPVWYRGEEIYCGIDTPVGDGWLQDEDVLDTWFSSALWTFSTLGWPDTTDDLRVYHPTSFMSPGYEILNLWVSRMILMSGFHLGQVPFKTVLIHGLVRAKDGRKFSKSLNNGIDPLDIIDRYGADALRMGLLISSSIGNDIKFDEQRIKGYSKFSNKLWNITRFILDATEGVPEKQPELRPEDSARVDELSALVKDVTEDYEQYRLYLAGEKLYHYIWHTLADVILEERKAVLAGNDTNAKQSAQWTLTHILKTSLKLLHPFMPFITEEIWSSLPHVETDMIMVAPWPKSNGGLGV
jgi:valyl-tRNA synthetase